MIFSKKLDHLLKKNLSNYHAISFDQNQLQELRISTADLNALLKAIDAVIDPSKTNENKDLIESNNIILNSLEEGLALFDKTGLCSKFSSAASEVHFSVKFKEQEVYFHDLFKQDTSLQNDTKEWIELLFCGRFDFFQIHDLGPNWAMCSDDRKVEIKYKPIYNSKNQLEKVLVITRDVTAELKAKQDADNQKNIAKTIIEICNSPKLFQDMLESVHHMNFEIRALVTVHEHHWQNSHDEVVKRQLHTIKGATSSFNLVSIVEKIHNYESLYSEAYETSEKLKLIEEFTEFIDISCNHISSQFGFILKKLLDTENNQQESYNQKRIDFMHELQNLNNPEIIQSFKEKFFLTPFSELFKQFNPVVEQLSLKLNKQISNLAIKSDSLFIQAESYQGLFSSFVHIFRNICDHAIETPEERVLLGKPAFGKITIECRKNNSSQIILKITDDGKGISKHKLEEKISKSIYARKYANGQNILNSIFEANITTKEEVSELSGRGIGLNAVMSELQKIKGSVDVQSTEGKGTTFEFILPLIDQIELENDFSENKFAS